MNLAPKNLQEFIGQNKIKRSIEISLEACKMRKEPFPHIMLYGGSGLGKTTLANIIAKEFKKNMHTFLAPSIESPAEINRTIRRIEKAEFLFIDEIHALPKKLQENLLTVITDFEVEYTRGYFIPINPFTLVGATTNLGELTEPFLSRFGFIIELEKYSYDEIAIIIGLNAEKNKIKVSADGVKKIAKVSRRNPRVANRVLQRCYDTKTVRKVKEIDTDIVKETLEYLQIDENGLNATDIKILNALADQFDLRPTGIKNLALALDLDQKSIEQFSEPLLVELKLLERTTRGRVLTQEGVAYIA
tara:strand:- start:5315 stop:6223 length:909 start_codon:yes stop_codon:yes gene_type:complete